jgi:hypothetical protein
MLVLLLSCNEDMKRKQMIYYSVGVIAMWLMKSKFGCAQLESPFVGPLFLFSVSYKCSFVSHSHDGGAAKLAGQPHMSCP